MGTKPVQLLLGIFTLLTTFCTYGSDKTGALQLLLEKAVQCDSALSRSLNDRDLVIKLAQDYHIFGIDAYVRLMLSREMNSYGNKIPTRTLKKILDVFEIKSSVTIEHLANGMAMMAIEHRLPDGSQTHISELTQLNSAFNVLKIADEDGVLPILLIMAIDFARLSLPFIRDDDKSKIVLSPTQKNILKLVQKWMGYARERRHVIKIGKMKEKKRQTWEEIVASRANSPSYKAYTFMRSQGLTGEEETFMTDGLLFEELVPSIYSVRGDSEEERIALVLEEMRSYFCPGEFQKILDTGHLGSYGVEIIFRALHDAHLESGCYERTLLIVGRARSLGILKNLAKAIREVAHFEYNNPSKFENMLRLLEIYVRRLDEILEM